MKVTTLALTLVLFAAAQTTTAGTQNSADKKTDSVEGLVTDILNSAEKSLPLVESDQTAAIQHIEDALRSVRSIKKSISKDTHVEAKSPLVVEDVKEYWFKYPRVDKKILKNETDFPVLHSKYSSGVLYRGESDRDVQNEGYAYFDYPFAFASLQTAKDALESGEIVRAKIALKWVFEAVYITPDFLISKNEQSLQDNNLEIDSIINIKGDFPVYSNTKDYLGISG